MKVRDLMESQIISIPETATYEEAARVLSQNKINGVLVLNESGKVIGIVSDKDLFRILYPFSTSFFENPELYLDLESREHKIEDVRQKPVSVFMTKNVHSIEPDVPIMRAGAIMLAKHVHRLPVIENGNLIGIITRSQIYGALLDSYIQE
ncbi:CBS domain-containing protein [Patescibacteria group bacterium]|nr:CBS domain-containing protein [Patescibacteria group bacterium]